jgi:hypothetical protein
MKHITRWGNIAFEISLTTQNGELIVNLAGKYRLVLVTVDDGWNGHCRT